MIDENKCSNKKPKLTQNNICVGIDMFESWVSIRCFDMCFGARDGWVVFIHLFSMIGCDFALIDSVLNQLRCQFQIFGKKRFLTNLFTLQ